jgi:hypothetical protein
MGEQAAGVAMNTRAVNRRAKGIVKPSSAMTDKKKTNVQKLLELLKHLYHSV